MYVQGLISFFSSPPLFFLDGDHRCGKNSTSYWGGKGLLYDFASFFSGTLALIYFGGSKKRGEEGKLIGKIKSRTCISSDLTLHLCCTILYVRCRIGHYCASDTG